MSPQSRKLSAETQLYWLPLFCKSDLNIRSVWIINLELDVLGPAHHPDQSDWE